METWTDVIEWMKSNPEGFVLCSLPLFGVIEESLGLMIGTSPPYFTGRIVERIPKNTFSFVESITLDMFELKLNNGRT